MKRVLFVDDETNILDGLRRMLRPQRKEWEMVFAASGREALAEAAETSFDVIVTDMRMPEMDGAELLQRFAEEYPQTVRFVLSGHSELEGVMRAVSIAHQFLSKPCDVEILKGAVTRALSLRDLLHDERIEAVIGETDSLPSRPETYAEIVRALADPEVEIVKVAEIVESDVAMSAKMLQIVSSSFFGLPQQISDIRQATSFLGLDVVRDLALSIDVFRPPEGASPALTQLLADLQHESAWVGGIAKRMFDDKRMASEAFTAGMLHDVGILVSATQLPDQFSQALEISKQTHRPLQDVEYELNGVSHAEIGAYLLGVWGLPYTVLEVAAYHHRPAELGHEKFDALAAVHVASALVGSHSNSSSALSGASSQVDLTYLEALGVADRLEEWEEMVHGTLADVESEEDQ